MSKDTVGGMLHWHALSGIAASCAFMVRPQHMAMVLADILGVSIGLHWSVRQLWATLQFVLATPTRTGAESCPAGI